MRSLSFVNGPITHSDEWAAVNWRKTNRAVRNLRQRIFRAAKEGNLKKVHSLQKLMLRSHSNALASVRRVTQINDGKNTAGMDKVVVKTPTARARMVKEISSYTPWKAKPAKRVYIRKANGKLRPLGIPVVKDRCLQAMVKNALEPYWEAKFEASSYGFRPGRSCHDAITKVYLYARPNKTNKWVLDADIKGAFDNINHDFLLKTIGLVPGRELIKQWLKAGFMDGILFQETETGTPQGGVISPLLANIALHGMEEAVSVYRISKGPKNKGQKIVDYTNNRAVVRYADDFVVFCKSKEDAETCKGILKDWLRERGLELSEEKTRISHLSEGFDFLGFNIKHYKAPRTSKTGWKLLIKPSKKSVQKLRDKLRDKWLSLRGHRVEVVIKELNPVIRGWANYFRIGVSSKIFAGLDNWMYIRGIRYAKHTHPKKSLKWRKNRYWGRLNLDRNDYLVFGDKRTGNHMKKFSWFPIQRHALVTGTSSPDDPNLREYWAKRNAAKTKDLSPTKQKLATWQKGLCANCGDSLFNGEEIHIHHKVWKSKGGKNNYSNLQIMHLFCHQQIHAKGISG